MSDYTAEAYRTTQKILDVPKRYKLHITNVQAYEDGYSARLWTDAPKYLVKSWIRTTGLNQYRIQKIFGTHADFYRIEFKL